MFSPKRLLKGVNSESLIEIQDVLSEEISFQNLMVGVAYFERFALVEVQNL